jgi:prefoldin subunit 5
MSQSPDSEVRVKYQNICSALLRHCQQTHCVPITIETIKSRLRSMDLFILEAIKLVNILEKRYFEKEQELKKSITNDHNHLENLSSDIDLLKKYLSDFQQRLRNVEDVTHAKIPMLMRSTRPDINRAVKIVESLREKYNQIDKSLANPLQKYLTEKYSIISQSDIDKLKTYILEIQRTLKDVENMKRT